MGIHQLLDTTAAITRLDPDDDDADKEGYVAHVTSQRCRIEQVDPAFSPVATGASYRTWRMWVDRDADIMVTDKVTIDSDVYIVQGVLDRQTHIEAAGHTAHKEISMEKSEVD